MEELAEVYARSLFEVARDTGRLDVVRERRAGEQHERDSLEQARVQREELRGQTRRDIEAETRRAIQQIRNEVADLTVVATEKVARKTLNDDDHKRLIDEALQEFDFSQLPTGGSPTGNGSGDGSSS